MKVVLLILLLTLTFGCSAPATVTLGSDIRIDSNFSTQETQIILEALDELGSASGLQFNVEITDADPNIVLDVECPDAENPENAMGYADIVHETPAKLVFCQRYDGDYSRYRLLVLHELIHGLSGKRSHIHQIGNVMYPSVEGNEAYRLTELDLNYLLN